MDDCSWREELAGWKRWNHAMAVRLLNHVPRMLARMQGAKYKHLHTSARDAPQVLIQDTRASSEYLRGKLRGQVKRYKAPASSLCDPFHWVQNNLAAGRRTLHDFSEGWQIILDIRVKGHMSWTSSVAAVELASGC